MSPRSMRTVAGQRLVTLDQRPRLAGALAWPARVCGVPFVEPRPEVIAAPRGRQRPAQAVAPTPSVPGPSRPSEPAPGGPGARDVMVRMAQWAVIIPADRWATERLFHHD